jgi:hypothetical protein
MKRRIMKVVFVSSKTVFKFPGGSILSKFLRLIGLKKKRKGSPFVKLSKDKP